jgi:hypothetical protein
MPGQVEETEKLSLSTFEPGRYRIKTCEHSDGKQPAGWGLSSWHAHGAVRDEESSWVAVHDGDHWPCDWLIEAGSAVGAYRIKTCGNNGGKQLAGWGLSAWHAFDAVHDEVCIDLQSHTHSHTSHLHIHLHPLPQ